MEGRDVSCKLGAITKKLAAENMHSWFRNKTNRSKPKRISEEPFYL